MKIFGSDAEFLPCYNFSKPNAVSFFGQAPLFPNMPSRHQPTRNIVRGTC